MEMLRATYGSDSEEDDADDSAAAPPIVGSRSSSGSSRSKADSVNGRSNLEQLDPLPPPPLDLLQSPNVLGIANKLLFFSLSVPLDLMTQEAWIAREFLQSPI